MSLIILKFITNINFITKSTKQISCNGIELNSTTRINVVLLKKKHGETAKGVKRNKNCSRLP